ncbi:MAG: hypothetical protein R3195_20615 [Gemmatimonadota bacterium]|nr:hypothetical protein [Gemmatimonadota bacterium]
MEYGGGGDPNRAPECGGDWFASKAESPLFEVQERITFGSGCSDGTVRLVLDVASSTLDYVFTSDSGASGAEGALVRGTDPGDRP